MFLYQLFCVWVMICTQESEATDEDDSGTAQMNANQSSTSHKRASARRLLSSHSSACHHDDCQIFASAKNDYNFSVSTLKHLEQYSHDNLREPCRYGDQCRAYIRCVDNGFRLDDRCHLLIFKHPPRNRNSAHQLPQGWNVFSTRHAKGQYRDDAIDTVRSDLNLSSEDRVVEKEVTKNGFQRVLTTRGHSLSEIVDEKLRHRRNRALPEPLCYDEMLSVILYTGCDCYGDLRGSERAGDYEKWKYFGASLKSATLKLQSDKYAKKSHARLLYSGMENVGWDEENGTLHQLDTFTSFSWDKSVAEEFAGNNGVVFEFTRPDEYYDYGEMDLYDIDYSGSGSGSADISWISKFPDECEYLLSRGYNVCRFGTPVRWAKNDSKMIQYVPISVIDF